MREKIIATLVGGGLLAATSADTITWSDAEAATGRINFYKALGGDWE